MSMLRVFGPSRVVLPAGGAQAVASTMAALSTQVRLAAAAQAASTLAAQLSSGVALQGAAQASAAATGTLAGSPVSTTITSFSLTSPSGGSDLPFAIGHVFRKGDVVAGQLGLDVTAHQVTPISYWDDGSVKHVIVAGRVDLSAGVARTVAINTNGSTGAPLTESDLIAANPQASVSYGAYGTVNLSALLGTAALVLTEHSGQHYAAFQYAATFPNDATVRAVFYVQLWSNSRYRVRVAIETGTSPQSGSAKSGTATVTIAGVQRFSAAVSMDAGTRWDVVAFNGSDPTITPAHNAAYLQTTRLFPNLGWTAPSAATLNALSATYTPMNGGGWPTDMGGTGYDQHIGLLAHWEALYLGTGDARAWNAMLARERAYGIYGLFYRHAATRLLPKFSDHPTYVSTSGERMSAGAYSWEANHFPNAGYMAWLLTGERYFLENLQATAYAAFICDGSSGGVSKQYGSQTRGRAWKFRTIAAAAATAPSGDPHYADYRASIVANLNAWYADHVAGSTPGTGLVGTYDDKEAGQTGFQHSIFESLWVTAVLGWTYEFELGLAPADKAKHLQVRDFSYRLPTGLTGRGAAQSEYSWRRAPGPYRMTIGPTTTTLYNTWNEVYQATYGDSLDSSPGLTLLEAYADDPSAFAFPQGNWGHVLAALSYAVDHGAANALAGMQRLTGASNWASNTAKYHDWPAYGVQPRSGVTALGQLAASMAPGTWAELTVPTLASVLADTGATGSMIPYCNSMPWNPLSNVIEICACDHFGGGNPMKHVRYIEATNTFVLVQSGIVSGIGHGFDHNAVNPYNGDLYHRQYGFGPLGLYRKLYGGSAFVALSEPANTSVAVSAGCCWWSGSFGGAGAHGAFMCFASGDDAKIVAYDPLANVWFYSQASGIAPSGANYDTRFEYSKVKNVAVFGGNGTTVRRLNANGTTTALVGAPTSVSSSALFVEEPVTGNFLLLSAGNMWELNPDGGGTWTPQTGLRAVPAGVNTTPNPTGHLFSFAVPIHKYGVVAFVSRLQSGGGPHTFFLYKHA